MREWSVLTSGPVQTRQLGRLLGEAARPGQVILLNGDLGAGKTCFAQGVALGVGLAADVPVTSPSYSLMNIHYGRMPLYHFDLYRLSQIDDLAELGYDEFAGVDGLTLVEWADRVADGLEACLTVEIVRLGESQRCLLFTALDHDGEQLLDRFARGWPDPAATGSPPPAVP